MNTPHTTPSPDAYLALAKAFVSTLKANTDAFDAGEIDLASYTRIKQMICGQIENIPAVHDEVSRLLRTTNPERYLPI